MMELKSLSVGTASASPQSRLEKVTNLYERNLFQQAYRETVDCWTPATRLSDLSIDELILGMRLAARLGGSRLSRWLAREALKRGPSDPKVRYYASHIKVRGRHKCDHFREIQARPELEGANPDTQASWLGYIAMQWASIRDFENAHKCLDLAHRWSPVDAWVLSCESNVHSSQDQWDRALRAAETAWELNPGAPYTARALGNSLLDLRRVEEAAHRLAEAAEHSESYEVVLTACWYLGALAETCTGEERTRAVARAQYLVERAPGLAPLADWETHAEIARVRLDIAELADDHQAIEHWAREARSPFHRKVLENFRKNPNGLRIRLPFRHAIQRHNECLPTSIGSAMEAMGTPIDADAMAADLTFGGTLEWAAADWLEKRGYVVRLFVATPEVAAGLIKNGFAFSMTLEWDTSAHAVAVVGLDEAAGTVMIHDPGSFRSTEYLLESLGKDEAPLGPPAMVAVRPEKAPVLDQLLPPVEAETTTAREARRRMRYLQGPAAAREVVTATAMRHPSHPATRLLQALQDHEDGRIGIALAQFQNLLGEFPGSAFVRYNLLACCRSLRNTALMRKMLGDVVERGVLPGIESQQQWRYPPSNYVTEYADLLRLSGATSDQAEGLLLTLLDRDGFCASAWHNYADLLWSKPDYEGALLGYRIAACLAERNEHYARAYSDALARLGREEDGFAWLSQRVRRFGAALEGVETWITLIDALEDAGRPERALAVAGEALAAQGGSAELLGFLAPFQARMGNWPEAEGLLKRLEQTGNRALFHRASSRFHAMRGELDQALEHAEKWLADVPLDMPAREEVANLLSRRHGPDAAIARARAWLAERPAHEDLEELYCRQLECNVYASWRKYSVLLRRVKRNREDGWAWRELAYCAMYDFELADGKLQRRLAPRIELYLDQCDRTSPGQVSTLRARARWVECRSAWPEAVAQWLDAIEREPGNMYSYRRLWDCAARLKGEERLAVWTKVESALLRETGHSSVAKEIIALAAERFGTGFAEEAAARWTRLRPEDPEIVEACVDLLLNHGHGRTDYERALQTLLPELKRFPFHLGLRSSHAIALQQLGRFDEAEEAFHEIVRRHPDNTWSRIRLAWMKQRRGETEAALKDLEEAAARDPQNPGIHRAKTEILMEEQRFPEARATIAETTKRFPADVDWRRNAIRLLVECGDPEQAIATARAGIVEYPRGAYLWLLLGRTLSEHRQFAVQGELEACLRRSLSLNCNLYEAADYLAMLLGEQRRYAEAEDVLREIEKRMEDPSPALGRMAWIRRRKGEKQEATEDMTLLLQQYPWYDWGWAILLDWFEEDKSWDEARRTLAQAPPEQRTNTRYRQRRLELLAKAGASAEVLDSEWNSLLLDFPEESPLHLIRYDALCESKRWAEATEVLRHIRAIHPDSPYVLARWVDLLVREKKKEEAIASLLQLFFAEAEPSVWPPDHAWEVLERGNYQAEAYQACLAELKRRRNPTPRAILILATYSMERSGMQKKSFQPFLRTWFPHRGARDILKLLKMVDAMPEAGKVDRGPLLDKLSDFGYQRLVVRYWKKHGDKVEAQLGSWSETMRALTALKKHRAARKQFSGWQRRKGVKMWVVANYVTCLTGSHHLKETRSTCRAALAGLPHDHCARYLAYREAEACALLGDRTGFAECWARYREYFDGRLEEGEWFEARRRYLLADLPVMARHLRENELRSYKAKVRSLRWERFKLTFNSIRAPKAIKLRWWWIIWVIWILAIIFANSR